MGFGVGIAGFICFIINGLIGLWVLAIIIQVVLSWLLAFDVINPRNRLVSQVLYFLEMFTAPVMAPLRRIIPPLGAIDITPLIALLILQGVRAYLLPPACAALASLLTF